jgi:hypothetical protein
MKLGFGIILWFVLTSYQGVAQTIRRDTIAQKPSESWRNLYVPKTLLRVGAGYQGSFFSELGITRRKYSGEDLVTLGSAYYGAVEWTPSTKAAPEHLFGFKVGGELTLQPLVLGLEAKYYTDFRVREVLLTPKIGLGEALITGALVSQIFVCYGYNISLNDRPFDRIRPHQISVVLNPVNLSYVLNRKHYVKKLYK